MLVLISGTSVVELPLVTLGLAKYIFQSADETCALPLIVRTALSAAYAIVNVNTQTIIKHKLNVNIFLSFYSFFILSPTI